jgi:hypothetical protein
MILKDPRLLLKVHTTYKNVSQNTYAAMRFFDPEQQGSWQDAFID